MSTPQVLPNPDGFGARVTGLDLARPLAPRALDTVKAALSAHSFLWFPEQPMDDDALEAFTLQFGPFGTDLPYAAPLGERPHILEIRRDPEEKTSIFGGHWHSDGSFMEAPPALTLLHAKVIPSTGGDTLFADGYRAFEALSEKTRERLSGLQALHSSERPFGANGVYASETGRTGMDLRASQKEATCVHPLVRVHPVSGRAALFVNPVYTIRIEGLSEGRSAELLAFLFRHMTKGRYVFRHVWAPDMLTLWDNRCCMHNATGGYDGQARVLHRTVVAGEAPCGRSRSAPDQAVPTENLTPLTWWTLGRRAKHALPAWAIGRL